MNFLTKVKVLEFFESDPVFTQMAEDIKKLTTSKVLVNFDELDLRSLYTEAYQTVLKKYLDILSNEEFMEVYRERVYNKLRSEYATH